METKKRLIDANALSKSIKEGSGTELQKFVADVCVATAPTVDAVPVVHGRWVFGIANHREYMKCSVCLHSQTPTGVFAYCPNCGARMDGDGNDSEC